MALIKVTLPDWEESLERQDRKNYTWFKFQNKFFGEQSTFQMTDSQCVLFLYLKCEASKKGSGQLEILTELVAALLRKEELQISKDLTRLSELRLIAGTTPALGLPREEKRREEKKREEQTEKQEPEQAPEQVALPLISQQPIKASFEIVEEKLTYDRDHESVALKPKPNELPRLAILWNTHAHRDLPRVVRCSDPRRRKALARLKEEKESFWIELILRIGQSPFLTGNVESKDGRPPFRADFDWILNQTNVDKILEGKYENRKSKDRAEGPSNALEWCKQQEILKRGSQNES